MLKRVYLIMSLSILTLITTSLILFVTSYDFIHATIITLSLTIIIACLLIIFYKNRKKILEITIYSLFTIILFTFISIVPLQFRYIFVLVLFCISSSVVFISQYQKDRIQNKNNDNSKDEYKALNDPDELTVEDKRKMKYIKFIILILSILSIISWSIIIVDNYRPFAILCMIIPVISVFIYIKYNKFVIVDDDEESETFTSKAININAPIFVPLGALGLISLISFNIIDLFMLIIWSISIILIGIFFYIVLVKFLRKNITWFLIIGLIIAAPTYTININYIFDNSQPTYISTSLIEKKIIESDEGPNQYLFKIQLSNNKIVDIKVSSSFYETTKIGDEVVFIEKSGFLGIKYGGIIENE